MIVRIDQILTKKIKIDQKGLVVSVGSPNFAQKVMSNPAFMSVVFEGDRREYARTDSKGLSFIETLL